MKAFLTEGFRIPILMFRTFDFADADFSELAGEVEADVLEILLCHLQHVARVSEEDIATFDVGCHVLIFRLFEPVSYTHLKLPTILRV